MKAVVTQSRLSRLGLFDRPARILNIGQTGVPAELGGGLVDWSFAHGAAQVLAQMRQERFDHVLAGRTVAQQPVWPLIRRMKSVRRKQKWSLVAPLASHAEEVMARSLGVVRIFDSPPDLEAILELVAGSIEVEQMLMEDAMDPKERRLGIRNLQPQAF